MYEFRDASFRGVAFFVDSASMEGGRRVAEHEFPGLDVPYIEDLGSKAKSFSIEAFVIGEDYMDRRDELLNALDQNGPGLLIHPYRGELNVQVKTFSVRETKGEIGMATFSISFAQTESVVYTFSQADQSAGVIADIEAMEEAVGEFFEELYDSDIGSVVNQAVETIRASISLVQSTLDGVMGLAKVADRFMQQVGRIYLEASILAQTPRAIAQRFQSVLRMPAYLMPPKKGFDKYLQLYSILKKSFADKSYAANQTSAIERNNDRLFESMLTLTALGEAARAALYIPVTTTEDALAIRSKMVELCDQIMEDVESDSVFESVRKLKISLSRAIPQEGVALKSIALHEVKSPTNSLRLTYELYGSLDSEEDIIARNAIRDPSRIDSGTVRVVK